MIKKPFFVGNNVCLDPVEEHILDDYLRWFAKPKSRGRGEIRPRTVEEIKAWLVEIGKNQKNCYFSIRIEGVNVGHLGIRGIDPEGRQGELDWFIGEGRLDDRIDPKEIVSWLRYFLDVHLGVKDLIVPLGCGLSDEVFQEVGFELKARNHRGSLIYKVVH